MSTLNDLLTTLREAEDGLLDMDMSELQATLGSVRHKVDDIHEVMSRLESESERMFKLSKSFAIRKKSLDNQLKRLKEYIMYSMELDGALELYGDTHKLKLYTRSSMKVKNQEIDSSLFMDYPEVITRTYAFDKNVLKDKHKQDPEKYAFLMEKTESKHIKVSVR